MVYLGQRGVKMPRLRLDDHDKTLLLNALDLAISGERSVKIILDLVGIKAKIDASRR
jgi:hypothetical protein